MMRRIGSTAATLASVVAIGCTDRASDSGATAEGSGTTQSVDESSSTTSGMTGGPTTTTTTMTPTASTETADASTTDATQTGTTGDTGAMLGPCEAQDGDDVEGPPRITAIAFVDDRTLSLTFSEPIAPIDAVDPTKFRLSAGIGYGATMTTYWDPLALLCSSSDYCTRDYVDVIDVGCLPDDPSTPAVAIDIFSPLVCSTLDFFTQYNDAYLLLHYAGDGPGITDLAGEMLAPIGPDWIVNPELVLYAAGHFAAMDPVVPIPCVGP